MRTFNFFSSYIGNLRITSNKKTYLAMTITLTIVASLLLLQYYNLRIQKLEREILQIESSLQSRQNKQKVAEVMDKENKFKIMEKYYDVLSQLDLKINSLNKINQNLLSTISTAVPPEISFRTLSLSSSEFEIQGVAKDNISIAKFEHNLRNLSIFSSVHVSTIHVSANNKSTYDFFVTCKLKDVNP